MAIKLVDSAGATMVLQQTTLQTLEQLVYEEGYGFEALDVSSATKSAGCEHLVGHVYR